MKTEKRFLMWYIGKYTKIVHEKIKIYDKRGRFESGESACIPCSVGDVEQLRFARFR